MIRRLATWVWQVDWLVIPIAFLLLFTSRWIWVGFVGAGALILYRWARTGSLLPAGAATLPLLILLGMTGIGFAISPARDLAVVSAAQVVAGVTIYLTLSRRIQTPVDLGRAAALLVLLGLGFALVAPFTVNWAHKIFVFDLVYSRPWLRLPDTTNPNILAGAIALCVPMALGLLGQRASWQRLLGACSLVPMIFVLVLLQSRGAWFALAIGFGVWLTLYQKWFLPLIPLALIGAFAVNALLGGPSPAQLVYGEIGTETVGTLVQRQELWSQAIYLIRESPLLGIGLGAWKTISPYVWPYSAAQPGRVFNHAHNLFLQVALDTGLVGLAAFGVLLALGVRNAWQAYRSNFQRPLAIGLLAAFAVLLVHGLGDVIVWGTAKSGIVLWILLSLSYGLEQIWRAEKGRL